MPPRVPPPPSFLVCVLYENITYVTEHSFSPVLQEETFYSVTVTYPISRPIRRTVIFSLEILEKNNDECVLILAIYWKKTGLLHTKIFFLLALQPPTGVVFYSPIAGFILLA